jgi:hypothetical protein
MTGAQHKYGGASRTAESEPDASPMPGCVASVVTPFSLRKHAMPVLWCNIDFVCHDGGSYDINGCLG